MWDFLNALLRGLQVGAIYGLVAVGLNIIFAATRVFNFAYGEMVMVGAMFGVSLWVSDRLPLGIAVVVVVLTAAAIGIGTELIAVRRLAHLPDATLWMLSTLGVAIIVRSLTTYLATRTGGDNADRTFPNYINVRTLEFGQLTFILQRFILIPIALVLTLFVSLWLGRSRWGRGLMALAADREGAAMRGLPVGLLAVSAFALGGAIAGFAGFMSGPITQASTTMGFGLTLSAFIAATVGGIPNLWGALVGGALLGIVEQLSGLYLGPALQSPISLLLLLAVLLVKPSGLLGRAVRTV